MKLTHLSQLLCLALMGVSGVLLPAAPGMAQSLIVPDETLGGERSQVIENFGGLPVEVITGGARRDRNLFHSFGEFNVDEGRGAFFFSPAGLAAIFSRVTGSNPSNILGTLGTFGDSAPDLFLMNPNGIIFGPNSSLDVQGSFAAVTADAIQFGDQGFFSATNPEAPSDLLTINPSAFLFNQLPPGNIINTSVVPVGFQVPDGENLLLLGGDVLVVGSQLGALGGRIDIGAVGGVGTVGFATDGSLTFPENLERADVVLANGALLDVRRDDGGEITVTAQNIDLTDGSVLFAGITPGFGSTDSQAGDIVLNAVNNVRIAGSGVLNNVFTNAVGTGGNIRITARNLDVLNGALLDASTLGDGDAGSVLITAGDRVTFDFSDAGSIVEVGGVGDGGNIDITTATLEVLNGAQLLTNTRGEGNAGSVIIDASDRATFAGTSTDGAFPSGASSAVEVSGVGNGGNIDITAATLEVLDGAQLVASTFGEGNAGSVIINASDQATFAGTSADGTLATSAFSTVEADGVGDGGNIDINTATLEVLDGAQLQASTVGDGNAGSVIINASDRATFAGTSADGGFVSAAASTVEAGSMGNGGNIDITTTTLEVRNRAQLRASTFSEGNAGSVIIDASDRVTFDFGFALSTVEAGGVGDGSNIDITAATLEVLNGAQLQTSTSGTGNAGSIIIDASDQVTLAGTSADGMFLSNAFSTVEAGGVGTGGNIEITTATLEVLDGAGLTASTFGEGNAGSVIITASDQVTFAGTSADGALASSASSSVETGGMGNGGNIEITTATLEVLDGAGLTASTFGEGSAGSVIITAGDRVTFAGPSADGELVSNALSTVEAGGVGDGGNINITTATLEVLNGAQLQTSTSGEGNAGSIIIDASDRLTLAGTSADGAFVSNAFSTVEAGGVGDGGNINIITATLEVFDGAGLTASTFGDGNAGSVIINASDRVTFAGTSADGGVASGASSSVVGGAGNGGNIDITTTALEVLNGAQLSASTFGEGSAGNVIINASDRVTFAGTSADGEFASSATSGVGDEGMGDGGNINITTTVLDVLNEAGLATSTLSEGNAGSVIINASDRVTFDLGFAFSTVEANSVGDGGNIEITTTVLEVLNGAQLQASTSGAGNAGSVIIDAGDQAIFVGDTSEALSTVEAGGVGNGGNIEISTTLLAVLDGAQLAASTVGEGNAGSVIIDASDRAIFDLGLAFSSVEAGSIGNGGNIDITTTVLDVLDGAALVASTRGEGDAGDIIITARERATFDAGSAFSTVEAGGVGDGGNIDVTTTVLEVLAGAGLFANTRGEGSAGSVIVNAADEVLLVNGVIASSVEATAVSGEGGDIRIRAGEMRLERSLITAQSLLSPDEAGASSLRRATLASIQGDAGDVLIVVDDVLTLTDSDITTQAVAFAGGEITIWASDIRLFGDSDITTNVQSGTAGGGDIILTADTILAFDDSDILAFAADGQGGNITVNAPAFFGEGFTLLSLVAAPAGLDGNDRVDINATGAFSGTVTLPDISFIQNSLAGLPTRLINTEALIANSCVARNEDGSSTFVITGAGGLPLRPGDLAPSLYPTGDVRTVPAEDAQSWQPGDPIIEPDGVYQLPNGDLILSHACRAPRR